MLRIGSNTSFSPRYGVIYIAAFFFGILSVQAQDQQTINHFILKENLINNGKLAIIACDTSEQPLDHLNGDYTFTINGFKNVLHFRDGIATSPQPIDKSSFVFIKHENNAGDHSSLYYVLKKENGLKPVKIGSFMLLFIPLGILLIAFMFRKLILVGILGVVVYLYFHYDKGLSFDAYADTLISSVKNLFFH